MASKYLQCSTCGETNSYDISDFTIETILQELTYRVKILRVGDDDLERIIALAKKSVQKTLEEVIKREHFELIIDKYTSAQIEYALPIKEP